MFKKTHRNQTRSTTAKQRQETAPQLALTSNLPPPTRDYTAAPLTTVYKQNASYWSSKKTKAPSCQSVAVIEKLPVATSPLTESEWSPVTVSGRSSIRSSEEKEEAPMLTPQLQPVDMLDLEQLQPFVPQTQFFPRVQMSDPGLRSETLDSQVIQQIAPELFAVLQTIKTKFLPFVTEKSIQDGEVEITPCLVGSYVQKFHPEPLCDYPVEPNDIDFEFFCHTKTMDELTIFFGKLNRQITAPDFFSSYPANTRSISCHFLHKHRIKVDIKFTIFTDESIDSFIANSLTKRVICPKANLIRFPWSFEKNTLLTILYHRNWLDFTMPPYRQGTQDFATNLIAYALLFHHLNPYYPVTYRFVYSISEFITEIGLNDNLYQSIKADFNQLYRNKFALQHTTNPDEIPQQEQMIDSIFTSTLTSLKTLHYLYIINIDSIPSSSELPLAKNKTDTHATTNTDSSEQAISLASTVTSDMKAKLNTPPNNAESTLQPTSDATPTVTENNPLFSPPRAIDRYHFFTNYTAIDSFCNAVIRQMIILGLPHLQELGDNPVAQLKRNIGTIDGNIDMSQVINHFDEQYPEINLIIRIQDPQTMSLIPIRRDKPKRDPLITERIEMELVQHNNHYSVLLSKRRTSTNEFITIIPVSPRGEQCPMPPMRIPQEDVTLAMQTEVQMRKIQLEQPGTEVALTTNQYNS